MPTIKISQLTEKPTMAGTEEVLINDSGTSKKFSTQRFLDVKTATETARDAALTAQTAAETAETNAETAETNASGSATTATTQATNAASSASAASTSASNASTSATSASGSATAAAASAASAAATYDTFDDRYLGNKASDPTTDNDGDALVQGMLYFDSTNNLMKVYDGSSWITTSSATLATLDVYKFTATSGQTAFTGTDDDGNTLSIKPTAEMVTLNGIVLESGADYTVTTSTLTLLAGATVSDEVNVYAFGNFELADHYSKTASDARYLLDSEVTNLAQVKSFNSSDYATAAHNHTGTYEPADATIVKDADIGVTVQAYDANLVSDATYVATDENFTTADHSKLDGIEASANNYVHPANHAISVITGLQTALDSKLSKAGGTMTGDVSLGDNVKAKFGAGNDLQIYHDGSNSWIKDVGTGDLKIQATNDLTLMGYSSQDTFLNCNSNGSVDLYYDNALKLATTSTGIDVTGRITTDAITEDSSGNVGIGTTSPATALDVNGTVSATTVDLGNWTITESAGVLYFATSGTNKMKLDASGNLTVTGNVTGYGTI